MATGDGINVYGSYATVQASASVADAAISGGSVTDIETALTTEKLMFLLDFKIIITSGTPVANGYIAIYKRNSDQRPPTTSYKQVHVGNAVLDVATGNYYLRGVPNDDVLDRYYALNESGTTLTFSVQARGRTYGGAA